MVMGWKRLTDMERMQWGKGPPEKGRIKRGFRRNSGGVFDGAMPLI